MALIGKIDFTKRISRKCPSILLLIVGERRPCLMELRRFDQRGWRYLVWRFRRFRRFEARSFMVVALSSAEATPTTALPVSTPSVTGWVYVVFGGVSSLMVKGVRRTTLAFPSLSRSRAMAGTQGITGLPSGVRTYTRHISRSFRKNALL